MNGFTAPLPEILNSKPPSLLYFGHLLNDIVPLAWSQVEGHWPDLAGPGGIVM
jgi:hypothetical protein